MINDFWALWTCSMWKCPSKYARKCYGFPRTHLPFLPHNMARPPKNMFATALHISPKKNVRKKPRAPHYLAEPFSSVLKPSSASEPFFCHISWRQRDGGTMRAKRLKKATPHYMAGPFAQLCCIYKDFGGICATLSGGNPP